MTRISKFLLAVFLVLGMVSLGQAQTTTTSTTLSAAITDRSTTQFTVASATGFTAGSTLAFVDSEAIAITAVSGTTITGRRGASGTVSTHASGTTIWVGPTGAGPFFSSSGTNPPRAGSCTSTNELYLPQIDVTTGNRYNCTASLWVIDGGPATVITGLSTLSATGNIASTTGIFVGGTVGANVGRVQFANATSGTVTIQPVTGALGTQTVSVPAATQTIGQIEVSFIDDAGTPVVTDRVFFVGTRPWIVTACSQVHSVAAGGVSTIQVTKETTTGAPGTGTDLLTAAFDLNATANTVQAKTSGDFVSLAARTLATGDRLSVDYANAIQATVGNVITCSLIPNTP